MATVSHSDEKELRSKLSSNPLSHISSSSLNSLIKLYAEQQSSSGSDDIIIELVIVILQLLAYHDILIAFADLVLKIKKVEDPHSEDPLKTVLEDIKKLGRTILKLDADHPSIITAIVTKALQPSEKNTFQESASGIVTINPKPQKGLLSQFIDWTLDHVIKFLNYEKSPSKFLEGNFAPVKHETRPTADLTIKGQLPECLNGVMVRNGPNPQFEPIANYGWMDGDSMLHSIYFKKGKATYASRYVETSRYKQEQVFGREEFIQYGDLKGSFGAFMACVQLLKQKLGILDVSQGWFNANTGVVYHAGLLMVSEDFDKPYAINVDLEDGHLETLGINNYHNKLTGHFIAHPKKDSNTREMFILGSSYKSPYATYNIVTEDGYLNDPVRITTSGPTYIHDFGITEKYVIFMDLSFCFNPEVMVKNDDWVYNYDRQKDARFGILPRYEKNENKIKWFEFKQPFFIFHNGNSWEEDEDTIILISCIMEEPKKNDSLKSQTKYGAKGKPWIFYSPGHVYNGSSRQRRSSTLQGGSKDDKHEHVKLALPILYKLSFNMKTGKCTRTHLSGTPCDYPKVNENYIGRRSNYIYTSEFNKEAKIIGIAKTDLQWESELKLNLGEGKYGSEVTFVSRQSSIPCEEDDGYLTTFVYDEPNSKSFAYVICAQRMKVLASIELTNIRVPYGFHAAFVTEEELKAQKKMGK